MTFNGLTDNQAENHRKQYGSNRIKDIPAQTAGKRFAERFGRVPVKVYIILLLCCICFGIFFSFGSGLWNIVPCVIAVLIEAAAVFVCCVWESSLQKRTNKKRSYNGENKCKVYRCGNSVSEIYSGDIVKGDYVLLTAGDIVPAEGIVQTGDITIEKDGKTDLIRRHRNDELDEDITGEYTLERGTLITSGHAVLKVTEVGGEYTKQSAISSKGYTISIIVCSVLAAALTFYAAYTAEKSGEGMMSVPIQAAFYSALILMAGVGLKDPLGFYLSASKPEVRRNGADIRAFAPKNDILFIDKHCFVTDGKPVVTGFTDGNGSTVSKFYEIPYPLGTIAATAAAENTSALVNKGRIISADPYEAAEMTFMAERLKNTIDLEINAGLVKGTLAIDGYKRFIRGNPSEIISSCENCFDGSGKEKGFSSAIALKALAEELIFQGNKVIAYAAELWDGHKAFIGMITIREKCRSSAESAYKALSEHGCRPVLLVADSEASLPDRALTSAGADDEIAFEKLVAILPNEAAKTLKKIKIITGKCDKEQLIEIAKLAGKTAGVTAVDVKDVLECENADTVYASYESCAAAKDFSDCVVYDGLASVAVSMECSAEIRRAAAGYEVIRAVMLILAAAMMYFGAQFGSFAFIGAALLDIVITGLAAFLLGRICKKRCAECDKTSKEVRS
ncbi:MAG: cation-transporting P-type ATPase [Oscillospiraceae bacterium]